MLNQYIRFIFEASCDTDDWSNNVENSSLITAINYILQYINIKTVILNFNIISQYNYFYCNFNQINEALRPLTKT